MISHPPKNNKNNNNQETTNKRSTDASIYRQRDEHNYILPSAKSVDIYI